MSRTRKTKEQLVNELAETHARIVELEVSEAERKRAEEALERRAAQLAVINDISGQVAAVLETNNLLKRAAHLIHESFGYDQVTFLLVDPEQDEMVMKARVGSLADLFPIGHRMKLGKGMIGWVGRQGETLLANDVNAEPRYVNPFPDKVKTQSELVVPVRMGEKVMGILDIQDPELNAFDENDVMVMETLASQIAAAVENARLYEKVQRELVERELAEEASQKAYAEMEKRVEELAVLNELGQVLTARLSVEEVLNEAYQQASRLVGTTNFYIALYNPEKDEISFAIQITESEVDKQTLTTIPADQGVSGYIIRNRTSVLIRGNLLEWQEETGVEMAGEPALSWLGVPLMIGDEVLGVMAV